MPHRILIADDAAFMREMLSEILTGAGYEVVAQAEDGARAVAQFREERPDLVTLDIVMPRKSGLDALREIRAIDPAARVIMCSALGQEALVMEALESGACDYVVKPFKPDQVLAALARALKPGEGAA